MVTPPKGDYASIPITLEAKKVGDGWDPAKDESDELAVVAGDDDVLRVAGGRPRGSSRAAGRR